MKNHAKNRRVKQAPQTSARLALTVLLAAAVCVLCLTGIWKGRPAKAATGPGRILATLSGSASGFGIMALNTDGSNSFNVTGNQGFFTWPSVAAQTGMIAFAYQNGAQGVIGYRIFVMNSDGTGIRQITFPDNLSSPQDQQDTMPVISPDGTKVAFISNRNPGQPELWVVNTDGTGLHQVTTKQYQSDFYGNQYESVVRSAVWSPNSLTLLVRAYRINQNILNPYPGTQFDEVLETISSNGGGEAFLKTNFKMSQDGEGVGLSNAIDWSSDGKMLYSVHNGPDTYIADRILGGNGDILSNTCDSYGCVRFSPDGQQLVYHTSQIVTVNLDGTNQKVLLDLGRTPFDSSPIWWAPGPAIPAPDHFTLAPNAVAVWNGRNSAVTPTLYDAQGNVIFHAATGWETVCDFRDPRINGNLCTGSALAVTVDTLRGVVTGDSIDRTVNLCAANAGLNSCIRVYNTDVPVVSVAATTPTTTEGSPNPAVITLSRLTNLDISLVLSYSLGGTAVQGVDYTADPQSLVMAPGQSSVSFNIRAISNSPNSGDRTVIFTLLPTVSNAYFVDGLNNTATVTIKDAPPSAGLSLSAIVPNKGGNTGSVTPIIYGQAMAQGATVKLSRSGQADIPGSSVSVAANGTSLTAVFDLTGKATGAWDVVVTNPDNQTASLIGAFTIEAGGAAQVWVDVVGRYTMRSDLEQIFYIAYGNSGGVDAPATLIQVSIPSDLSVIQVPQLPDGSDPTVIHDDDGGTILKFFVTTIPASASYYARFTLKTSPQLAHQDFELPIFAATAESLQADANQTIDPTITITPTVNQNTSNYAQMDIHVANAGDSQDTSVEVTITDVTAAEDPQVTIVETSTSTQFTITATVPKAPSSPSPAPNNSLQIAAHQTATRRFQPQDESTQLHKVSVKANQAKNKANTGINLYEHHQKLIEAKKQYSLQRTLTKCLESYGLLKASDVDNLDRYNDGALFMKQVRVAADIAALLNRGQLSQALGELSKLDDVMETAWYRYATDAIAKEIEETLLDPSFDPTKPVNKYIPQDLRDYIQSVYNPFLGINFNGEARRRIFMFMLRNCNPKLRVLLRNVKGRVVFSRDPNEKDGPQGGGGTPQFISGFEPMRYVISFENQATATAPAQTVVVTDQLDTSKLDLATFSFGPIGFGDTVVPLPAGLASYTTDVDLRPAKNLIARVNAQLDQNTGLITWRLTSIDPTTGQPTTDPLAGFLPPNQTSPEGQGTVAFSIMPKSSLTTGAEIRNKSRITFDANAPIDTNEWLNTIDNSAPSSHVLSIASPQCPGDFQVQWGGTDSGSGIMDFTIFVSDNNGPFTIWQLNTTATSATFTGQSGHTYAFRSTARDNGGNLEADHATNDAQVTINTAVSIATQPVGKQANAGTPVSFSVVAGGTGPLTYQWRKGGSNIVNATGSSYSISSVKLADAGSYDVVVKGPCGTLTSQSVTLTVNCPTITLTPTTLAAGKAWTSYSQTITPSGGTAPYTFNVTGLPSGVTASATSTSVTLSGLPLQAGSFNVTVTTTDGYGCMGSRTYTLSLGVPGDVRLSSDFDGDGKADLAIWRPATATFWIYNSASSSMTSKPWGVSTDIPVPGDYDGDGKADCAVWRPSTGTWIISNSSNGATVTGQWGNSTDVPVPGDYDGDGKTDLAIWRPSTGTWMIFKSTGGTMTVQWGTPGDVPVLGDYDGDGKTDLGIWRPATATFWIYSPATGSTITKQWGVSTDVPVPGDYDGDHKTDIALWRPSTGAWLIFQSSNGQSPNWVWGLSTDVPVSGDYDGDGKADLTIWRPSTGVWWTFKSMGGTLSPQWGTPGDLPIR